MDCQNPLRSIVLTLPAPVPYPLWKVYWKDCPPGLAYIGTAAPENRSCDDAGMASSVPTAMTLYVPHWREQRGKTQSEEEIRDTARCAIRCNCASQSRPPAGGGLD